MVSPSFIKREIRKVLMITIMLFILKELWQQLNFKDSHHDKEGIEPHFVEVPSLYDPNFQVINVSNEGKAPKIVTLNNACFLQRSKAEAFSDIMVFGALRNYSRIYSGIYKVFFSTVDWKHIVSSPSRLVTLPNSTAFILPIKYSAAFFHFIENQLIPLNELITASGYIPDYIFKFLVTHHNFQSERKIVVEYVTPNNTFMGKDVPIPGFYSALGIKKHSIAFYQGHSQSMPSRSIDKFSCHEQIIFHENLNYVQQPLDFSPSVRARDSFVDKVLRYYMITPGDCRYNMDKLKHPIRMIFIQRSAENNRRILNVDDLHRMALKYNLNSRIIQFEDLSSRNQLIEAYCADIIAGVTGSGLHWNIFAGVRTRHLGERGRALIEIAYPEAEWPFFFHEVAPSDQNLFLEQCRVPPSRVYLNNTLIFESDQFKILQMEAVNSGQRIGYAGKNANVHVPEELFERSLRNVLANIRSRP